MIRLITKTDLELLIDFYHKKNNLDKENIKQLYEGLNKDKIVVANVLKNSISSLIICNLIKNNYYIEKFETLHDDYEEIKDLISCLVRELRRDERGLNVLYDNTPYDEIMHEVMLENGLKCNYMDLICLDERDKIALINSNIALNDRSEDVLNYIYKNLVQDIKISDVYFGTSTLIPDKGTINLENTNVASLRDKEGKVIGTLRFALISDNIVLDSLYADDEDTLIALLNLVKNLTAKNLEIGLYPSRTKLIDLLESKGFIRQQTNYILKLN